MAARVLIAAQSVVGAYPTLPITANSLDLTETAGDATNGHYTPIVEAKTVVIAHNTNTGSTARTVTITSAPDAQGRTGDITAYSLGAGEISRPFGPFVAAGWANVGPTSPSPTRPPRPTTSSTRRAPTASPRTTSCASRP
jgi:hypothetical protein